MCWSMFLALSARFKTSLKYYFSKILLKSKTDVDVDVDVEAFCIV